MRFFAHDGKSTHGPAGIEELLKLPGFDGDTLVCPVGSDDSADWKPAMAYAPFKKALLEAMGASSSPMSPLGTARPNLQPMAALSPMSPLAPIAPLAPISPLASTPTAPLSAPAPVTPAPPAPVAKTVPCPRCAHPNLEEARYCNTCAARMDGRPEEVSAPPPATLLPTPAPTPILPKPVPAPAPDPAPAPAPFASEATSPLDLPKETRAPASDPFAHLDPLLTFPTEETSLPLPESPKRPLQPGKMGQLGAFEEPSFSAAPTPLSPSPSPALAPEPAPAAAVAVWKRPAVLAAFASAAVVAAGLAFVMLNKKAPAVTVAELTPSAQTPMPEPSSAPAAPLYSTPPATSSPMIPAPASPKSKTKSPKISGTRSSVPATASAKTKRTRKPRPAPALAATAAPAGEETLIESRTAEPKKSPAKARKTAKGKRAAKAAQTQTGPEEKDPLLEALLTDATQSAPEGAAATGAQAAEASGEKAAPAIGQSPAAKTSQFSLPGLKRPVSASDRAPSAKSRAPQAPNEEAAPAQTAGPDSTALAEPGKSAPPPGIEDEPAKSAEGDQLALVQVHEQFDFCAQLLSQGAYGDHYDTCLCKDTREASPLRGRRGFYVTSKKKDASSGHLETSAKIMSSKIEGGVAKVTARWKSGGADKGREVSQTWKLEDGLWCQAP